jgi:transcriptional regulator with XRE-family HTH domain
MSQLDLAVAAGTTPRHVSFVETGRSRPGTDLVLRFADVLAVPIRERNALLATAGLPPAYPEHGLGDDALRSVRDVLDRVLRGHEPYPGWVIGRGLRFLQATAGAERLFPGLVGADPAQVIDLWFGPGPFRERVANWPDVVRATLTTLRREALLTGDPQVAELVHRAETLTRDIPLLGDDRAPQPPVACPTLVVGTDLVRTVTTVLRFDTATEVTTSELRVELMFPADDASDTVLRKLTWSDT